MKFLVLNVVGFILGACFGSYARHKKIEPNTFLVLNLFLFLGIVFGAVLSLSLLNT